MFATRANQENAIYEQQTAAAAKSLNQGAKGLAPKTPFKVPLNDENAAGKTAGKGKNQDTVFGEGKASKLDKSAFVTPAGPRNRAPLGNKTTNAKATAFINAAPPTQEKPSAKQTSPRLRRAKIKVHDVEAVTAAAAAESDDDVPEIEYMPPREVPLPDYPEDCWPHDRTYPQFEGDNLTRGWWSEFARQEEDSGEEIEFGDFRAELERLEDREKKAAQKQQQATRSSVVSQKKGANTAAMQKTTRDPLTAHNKPPQTLKSRSAAAALSSKPTSTPSFAMPTAATKSRLPSSSIATNWKRKPTSDAPPATTNPRHGAAKVASNTTLGYSKGRAVSATARKPLFGIYNGEEELLAEGKSGTSSPVKTSLDTLFFKDSAGLDTAGGEAADEEDHEGFLGVAGRGGVALDGAGIDDELKDFQFEPVE